MEENTNSNDELTFIQPTPITPPVAQPIPVVVPAPVIPAIPIVPVATTTPTPPPQQYQAPTNAIPQKQIFFVGFWKRVAIQAIDNFAFAALGFFFPLIAGIAWIGNIILYYRKGQTIGDLVMQTKLVDQQTGLKPSGFHLTIRYLSKILSWLVFGLGFICVAWRKEKNAWHDSISSTRYIETKQYSGGITWLANILILIVLPGFAMPNAIKEHAELIEMIQPFLPETLQNKSTETENETEPVIVESNEEEVLIEDKNLIDEDVENEPDAIITEENLESDEIQLDRSITNDSDLEANIFNTDENSLLEDPIDEERSEDSDTEKNQNETISITHSPESIDIEALLAKMGEKMQEYDLDGAFAIYQNLNDLERKAWNKQFNVAEDFIFEDLKSIIAAAATLEKTNSETEPDTSTEKDESASEIISAEPIRFPGSFYFKKEEKIYYQESLIEAADFDTFATIESSLNFQKFWATDKNNVYAEGGKIVTDANPQSFELLHSKYGADGINVFYVSQKMLADVSSFSIFNAEFGSFAKDQHQVFFNGRPFEIADVNSFEETDNGIIQDKNNIYDRFGKIEKRQKVKAGVKRMPRPKN